MKFSNKSMTLPDVPLLTVEKLDTLTQWHKYALDASNSRTNLEEIAYYTGAEHMADSVIRLIHENIPVEKAVEIVKASPGMNKTRVILVGATIYILWKKRDKVKNKIKELEAEIKSYKDEIKDNYNKS